MFTTKGHTGPLTYFLPARCFNCAAKASLPSSLHDSTLSPIAVAK